MPPLARARRNVSLHNGEVSSSQIARMDQLALNRAQRAGRRRTPGAAVATPPASDSGLPVSDAVPSQVVRDVFAPRDDLRDVLTSVINACCKLLADLRAAVGDLQEQEQRRQQSDVLDCPVAMGTSQLLEHNRELCGGASPGALDGQLYAREDGNRVPAAPCIERAGDAADVAAGTTAPAAAFDIFDENDVCNVAVQAEASFFAPDVTDADTQTVAVATATFRDASLQVRPRLHSAAVQCELQRLSAAVQTDSQSPTLVDGHSQYESDDLRWCNALILESFDLVRRDISEFSAHLCPCDAVSGFAKQVCDFEEAFAACRMHVADAVADEIVVDSHAVSVDSRPQSSKKPPKKGKKNVRR